MAAMPELPAPQQINILLTGKVLTLQQIQVCVGVLVCVWVGVGFGVDTRKVWVTFELSN